MGEMWAIRKVPDMRTGLVSPEPWFDFRAGKFVANFAPSCVVACRETAEARLDDASRASYIPVEVVRLDG